MVELRKKYLLPDYFVIFVIVLIFMIQRIVLSKHQILHLLPNFTEIEELSGLTVIIAKVINISLHFNFNLYKFRLMKHFKTSLLLHFYMNLVYLEMFLMIFLKLKIIYLTYKVTLCIIIHKH